MTPGIVASTMSTDQVAAAERAGYWGDWINRLFCGLRSDLYGDSDFAGRMSTLRAGDIVLTRLEANRHRVMRSNSLARSTEIGYLKIVAPYVGCAGVGQKGREAWVTPDQWSIYDTTDSYAVANPVAVEHLIVMVPKDRLVERGVALEPLMARRLGGSGGIARLALETMRSAYRELPGMSEAAARGVGDAITQLVHLSMLDLAGIGTAMTRREALRERIKQHVGEHLGDDRLSVDSVAYEVPRGLARQRIAHSMPYNPIFGVFVEGQQVGLSSLFFPANRAKIRHRAQVHQVYVAAELRGRGIAKAMMDVVIAYARTIPDVEEVHLAVTIGNESARRLYVSGGFVPHMIDARYFKINGVYYDLEWMYLRLNSSENLTNR
mgnify:CR=1 FL=1